LGTTSTVFGNNPLHPGSQSVADPPHVRNFEFTFVVDGQDGRLVWDHSFSSVAATNEPFAWAFSADNKSIVGDDTDLKLPLIFLPQFQCDSFHTRLPPLPRRGSSAGLHAVMTLPAISNRLGGRESRRT
jgi:hypothetical protein